MAYGDEGLIPFIKQSFPIVYNTKSYNTPLTQYQQDTLTQLLEDEDINAADNDNQSALCHAAKTGHMDLVLFLLERGASIRFNYSGREFPIMCAFEFGQFKVALLLFRKSPAIYTLRQCCWCGFWPMIPGMVEVLKPDQRALDKLIDDCIEFWNGPPKFWGYQEQIRLMRFTRAKTIQTLIENGASPTTESLTNAIVFADANCVRVILQHSEISQDECDQPPAALALNSLVHSWRRVGQNSAIDIVNECCGILLHLLIYSPSTRDVSLFHDTVLCVDSLDGFERDEMFDTLSNLIALHHTLFSCRHTHNAPSPLQYATCVSESSLFAVLIRRGFPIPSNLRFFEGEKKEQRAIKMMTRIAREGWTPNPAHSDFYSPEFKLHLLHIAIAWRYLFADPYQLKDLPLMPLEILFRICSFVPRTWFANPTGFISPRIIDRCIKSMTSL